MSLQKFVGKQVNLEISGKTPIRGTLVDLGSDILVIHNGIQFLYIPLIHLQIMKLEPRLDTDTTVPTEMPFENQTESISYRKILMNAKGIFTELYITGNQSIHGYITSIMNDFFVFFSPVFHTVLVSLNHLKYLIPYTSNVTPYSLDPERFPVKPSSMTLSRTFDQQLKKLEGQFVVLDLGENPHKIGLLKNVENRTLELIMANGETVYTHMEHVKTVHIP